MSWVIVYTGQAQKDAKKIASSNLRPQAQRLLDLIARDPFRTPPPYEKLVGDLAGAYSRRINIQHRLVYQIYDAEHTVKVLLMCNSPRMNYFCGQWADLRSENAEKQPQNMLLWMRPPVVGRALRLPRE